MGSLSPKARAPWAHERLLRPDGRSEPLPAGPAR